MTLPANNTKGSSLGLDVGERRIGLALSDPLGISIRPLGVLERSDNAQVFLKLIEIVEQHSVVRVVVGMPQELGGEFGTQAEKVQLFVRKLQSSLVHGAGLGHLEVVTLDERLTSVQAEKISRGSKLKNRRKRELLDEISAVLILETYLELQRV